MSNNKHGSLMTSANASPEMLNNCESVTLGAAMSLFREYGVSHADFIAAHPECWCPLVPAAPLRSFLIAGGAA